MFAEGIARNIQRFAQLLADSAPAAPEATQPPETDEAAMAAAAAVQPGLSEEILTTLQEQLIRLLDMPPV